MTATNPVFSPLEFSPVEAFFFVGAWQPYPRRSAGRDEGRLSINIESWADERFAQHRFTKLDVPTDFYLSKNLLKPRLVADPPTAARIRAMATTLLLRKPWMPATDGQREFLYTAVKPLDAFSKPLMNAAATLGLNPERARIPDPQPTDKKIEGSQERPVIRIERSEFEAFEHAQKRLPSRPAREADYLLLAQRIISKHRARPRGAAPR